MWLLDCLVLSHKFLGTCSFCLFVCLLSFIPMLWLGELHCPGFCQLFLSPASCSLLLKPSSVFSSSGIIFFNSVIFILVLLQGNTVCYLDSGLAKIATENKCFGSEIFFILHIIKLFPSYDSSSKEFNIELNCKQTIDQDVADNFLSNWKKRCAFLKELVTFIY